MEGAAPSEKGPICKIRRQHLNNLAGTKRKQRFWREQQGPFMPFLCAKFKSRVTRKPVAILALVCLYLGVPLTSRVIAQGVFTIGPMVHWNLYPTETKTSYSLEASYWERPGDNYPFLGIDLGFEFARHTFRMYFELQTSVMFAGVSGGPVFEINQDYDSPDRPAGSSNHLGMQCSGWFWYAIGGDCRYRRIGGRTIVAPGLFAKIPLGDDW